LNQRTLVEWQRHASPKLGSDNIPSTSPLRMLAPLFNEPSDGNNPNVDVRAHGAYHCGQRSVCGIMLVSRAIRQIDQGDELVWCYGPHFRRHYKVSTACTSGAHSHSAPQPSQAHLHRAAAVLLRGHARVERRAFKQNCMALGWANEGDGAPEMLDELFDSWDADRSRSLEHDEIMSGLEEWAAAGMGQAQG